METTKYIIYAEGLNEIYNLDGTLKKNNATNDISVIDLTKLNENQKNTFEKFVNGEIVSKESLGEYLYEKLMEINGNIITSESLENADQWVKENTDWRDITDEEYIELFGIDKYNEVFGDD